LRRLPFLSLAPSKVEGLAPSRVEGLAPSRVEGAGFGEALWTAPPIGDVGLFDLIAHVI
jgi:hypothetical protein